MGKTPTTQGLITMHKKQQRRLEEQRKGVAILRNKYVESRTFLLPVFHRTPSTSCHIWVQVGHVWMHFLYDF